MRISPQPQRYWVPGLANILVIQVLLAAIALHLRRRLAPDARDGITLAGLVALLVITTDRDEWILSHWYAFLGDIPASLAVILSCLLVADGIDRRRTPGFAAGLALGLALEIKAIALLGIMPALLATFWFGWRSQDWISGRKLLQFAGAVLLPTGLAQLWRLWALGGLQGYLVHQKAWGSYFASEGGSGLSLLATAKSFGPFAARAATNGRVVIDYFAGGIAVAAVLALTLLMAARLLRSDNHVALPTAGSHGRQLRIAGALLWAAFMVHTCWWLLLSSTGWINHLLPALLYLAGSLALTLALPGTRPLVIATFLATATAAVPRLPAFQGGLPVWSRDPGVSSALEVRDLLVAQKAKGWRPLGCGWWVARDLEYLLPGVGNFEDCLRIDRADFGEDPLVLVRWVPFWNWGGDEQMQRFSETCEKTTLFRNAHYVVSLCTTPP
jgi:hypothetical protein